MQNPNKPTRHSTGIMGAALVAMLFTGGTALAAVATPGTHASAIAMKQKIKGDAVSITYAYLPQDGTLDIYAVNATGKIGATPLGKISLTAGDHRDIKVSLRSPPKEGMRLQAVLEKAGRPFKNSGDVPERTFKVL